MNKVLLVLFLSQLASTAQIYDYQTGEYRNMIVDVDNDGDVSGYDFDRNEFLWGNDNFLINSKGEIRNVNLDVDDGEVEGIWEYE